MMADYISREAALQAANEWVSEACMAPVMRVSRLFDKLAKVPAANVAEVAQGHWIMHNDDFGLTCECSHCHIETMGDSEYCLHCGARMDGGSE